MNESEVKKKMRLPCPLVAPLIHQVHIALLTVNF